MRDHFGYVFVAAEAASDMADKTFEVVDKMPHMGVAVDLSVDQRRMFYHWVEVVE
jgi:hypothetical protein